MNINFKNQKMRKLTILLSVFSIAILSSCRGYEREQDRLDRESEGKGELLKAESTKKVKKRERFSWPRARRLRPAPAGASPAESVPRCRPAAPRRGRARRRSSAWGCRNPAAGWRRAGPHL